jgi:XTP/dITP diphosphohydrolase
MPDAALSEIVIATSNPYKVEEVRAILEPLGVRVLGLRDIKAGDGGSGADVTAPMEDGDTFEANARLKALYYASALNRPCLADDSGLEVDALEGAPGIHSARFARIGTTRAERDDANNRKLIQKLRNVPEGKRAARFVCAMCLATPDGKIIAESRGVFEGRIGAKARGENGFGYDPLLVLEDGRTSAELSKEEKNARSHRGQAARAIAEKLR